MGSPRGRGRVRVWVVKRSDRKNLCLKIRWPSGRIKVKSAGTAKMRQAEREAARLEDSLSSGEDSETGRCTWRDFAAQYKAECLSFRSVRTVEAFDTASSWLKELCDVHYLSDVDAACLSKLSGRLLSLGKSQQTAKTYVARIQAAANWAHTLGLIGQPIQLRLNLVDRSQMPRPLTTEEFERIIDKTPGVVGVECSASWEFLLRGLWHSGLRLGEAIGMTWDTPGTIRVDGHCLRIPADRQKGRRSQLYPMTPDFAALLGNTPQESRSGHVFNPQLASRRGRVTHNRKTIGDTIAEIGRKARVVVSKDGGVHYATAKHFRHSFGARWAPHVSELTLMTLMRHQSIETTRKHYVGLAARETSEKVNSVWVAQMGAILGASKKGEVPSAGGK